MNMWASLSGTFQGIITFGAVVTALWAIYKGVFPLCMWCIGALKDMFASEQNIREEVLGATRDVQDSLSTILGEVKAVQSQLTYIRGFQLTTLDTHHNAMFVTNDKGDCIRTNRPHSRLTGFPSAEMMGRGWINAIAPEERDRVMTMWMRAVKDRREFDEEVMYIKPDKITRYPVHVSAYKILNEETNCVIGYLGEVTLVESGS